MRSRTAIWFECKIQYEKTMEDGLQKKVRRPKRHAISGEFDIKDIKIAPYKEIFFSDADSADRWYKAKLQFITIDEKTAKEKRSSVNYLVNAGTLNGAVKNIDEVMGGTMIDYVIASVAETQIMDVYEYGKDKQTDEKPEYEQ